MLTESDRERIGALDATGQAELVRNGQVTAHELVRAAIERIERLDPTLNAVVARDYERALDAVSARPPEGPFAGVPYLLKDLLVEAGGMRSCEGSRFLADNVSSADSKLVVRLRRAGLVILGRTSTSEFGMTPTVENAFFGTTRNPWHLGHTTGGSSGGSGAAVASGMVPMAHANDFGGSIRIPASCCGLFGLKPTRGRNPSAPRYGDAFLGWVAEHAVTRSVRDSAALLDATGGPVARDPYRAPSTEGRFADAVASPPGRLRIAFSTSRADGRPLHRECRAAVEDAARLCSELGHEVFERDLVQLTPEVGKAIDTVYLAGLSRVLRYWERRLARRPRPDELEPFTRALDEHGRRVSGTELLRARTDLQSFTRAATAEFGDLDAWLWPTLAQPPPRLGTMVGTEENPWAGNDVVAQIMGFPLITANITGQPAMSLPLHWSREGLPIGVHALGRYGDEATLLRLAGQLERARPWGGRLPPVWTAA